MAKNLEQFESGKFYHVYNRANGSEKLFFQEKNYTYFISQLRKYLYRKVEFHAYCLIPNHFHLLIRCKEIKDYNELSDQFKKLFSAYSRAINNQENRMGSLFMKPFKRKLIDTESYYSEVIRYIHHNPIKHGLMTNFSSYKWSSYQSLLADGPTFLNRSFVLGWYGNRDEFIKFHEIDGKELDKSLVLE
ncbi:MAG: transposase [Bacteroidetes bacterium]|nr:transposase [Bacteroidota bacterium]